MQAGVWNSEVSDPGYSVADRTVAEAADLGLQQYET